MRKTKKKNNKFIFFVWESALNVFGMGFFIIGFCVALLQLLLGNPKIYEEYFNVIHCILALLSMLTLRVSVIDEDGITIKMLLLPIRKKLLYNQILFIGYTRAVGSASILVKDYYYSWWKCFLYRIYLPTIKYQGNEKNTFILLSFIKEHYSKEIIPTGPGAENLCKKVNAYNQKKTKIKE